MTTDLDLRFTPFSLRGSWINFATPASSQYQPLGPGLYMRSNHFRPLAEREIFKIVLLDKNSREEVETELVATPDCLRIQARNASTYAEIVFDGTDSIRISGHQSNLSIRCTLGGATNPENATHFAAYEDGPDGIAINCRAAHVRYQFNPLSGDIKLDSDWDVDNSSYANIEVSCGEDAFWEITIDEYTSTYISKSRKPVDELKESNLQSFNKFLRCTPDKGPEWDSANATAAYILWSCLMRPYGQLGRESMFMSLNWMDQIWSWDNCFNMAALVPIDSNLAFDQLMIFADHQDEFGAYPDGLNDGFKHYNFSKPPVQSILLRWVMETEPGFLDSQRKSEVYDTLSKFTNWWLDHRRYLGESLVHGYHGNDIGWDNGSLMRDGGPLISPDVNAFMVDQCRFLGMLANELGKLHEASVWHIEADKIETAILEKLWNGNEFVAIHLPSANKLTSHSHAACLPALLGLSLPEPIRIQLLERIKPLITAHGFATEDPTSPLYIPDGYWRGPIWAPTTLLMVIGLERLGEEEMAKDVALKFCRMCAKNGFGENFDALTGDALRDRGYTWTASVYLELLKRYA